MKIMENIQFAHYKFYSNRIIDVLLIVDLLILRHTLFILSDSNNTVFYSWINNKQRKNFGFYVISYLII